MPLSYTQYTGNGTTTDFQLSFQYLNKAHVVLKVNATTTAYTWVNDSTIRVATAPAQGVPVWIYRVTPRNEALTVFQDSAGFREADLNRLTKQLLYITQEAYDNADLPLMAEWREEFRQGLVEMRSIYEQAQSIVTQFDGLIESAESTLDAYALSKTAMLDTAAADAVTTINQTTTRLETLRQELIAARQDLVMSMALLNSIETSVAGNKTAAEAAVVSAQTAATNAQTAKTGAETAAASAQTAKTGAETAAASAQTAKTGAETAATNAQNAANTAASTAAQGVQTQLQTLLSDAQAAKGAAETAATNAQTSKGAAETAATNAQNAASTAAANVQTLLQAIQTGVQSTKTTIDGQLAQATTLRDETLAYRNASEGFKNDAEDAARNAAMYAQNAFGAAAPAWVSGQTYSFPTVVAAANGHTYRCTGTNVTTDPEDDARNWCLLTVTPNATFEYDVSGNLMPSILPVPSSEWDVDENGDIMPKA